MDNTKPKQEMKIGNYIALMIAISIVVVLVGGILIKSLGTSILLNQRVISKKQAAQSTLAADVIAANKITQQYKSLGDRAKLADDALPTSPDIPGLSNALEAMAGVSGVQFTDVSTTNVGGAASAATATGAAGSLSSSGSIPLPITITATSSYANLNRFLTAIESSLRPITITGLELTGTDAKLNITISANTYYQNPVSFSISKVTVK